MNELPLPVLFSISLSLYSFFLFLVHRPLTHTHTLTHSHTHSRTHTLTRTLAHSLAHTHTHTHTHSLTNIHSISVLLSLSLLSPVSFFRLSYSNTPAMHVKNNKIS